MLMQRLGWRELRRSPAGIVGLAFVSVVVLIALFGSAIAPYPPDQMHLAIADAPPQLGHLFGTDQFGRDVFSRVLIGTRTSLVISASAVAGAMVAGVLLALIAGFFGGVIDLLLTRFVDVFLAIPALLIALGILAITGPSGPAVSLALAIAYTPTTARVLRSAVVSARAQPYVEASAGMGASAASVLATDVVPTILPTVVVQASAALAWGILDEANLGFLGLGVQPPNPSWGSILTEGREYFFQAPWVPVGAGLAVVIAVFGFNLLGDGLRDVFDPRAWDITVGKFTMPRPVATTASDALTAATE